VRRSRLSRGIRVTTVLHGRRDCNESVTVALDRHEGFSEDNIPPLTSWLLQVPNKSEADPGAIAAGVVCEKLSST